MKQTGIYLLLLLLTACHGYREKKVAMNAPFDKQGHRGCRGLMPENTIAAMYKAIDLNVTTLEMDVVITADSQVVVSHEPWMGYEIATKPDGTLVTEQEEKQLNIYRMPYSEVQRYDVGLRPHPRFPKQQKMAAAKPLLAALIESVKVHCRVHQKTVPFFNIEIKSLPAGDERYHPAPARFVSLLMAVIEEKKLKEKIIIQSFDFRALQELHRRYPAISTALLIEDTDGRNIEEQLKALGYTPTIYSPHYKLVTPELITFCHSRRIKVVPWTVNTKEDIERLQKMGVDGIITDYPDLF
jgi:glycerophosphoryl diester phosphodiesterase